MTTSGKRDMFPAVLAVVFALIPRTRSPQTAFRF
jgi:hypothetical protein